MPRSAVLPRQRYSLMRWVKKIFRVDGDGRAGADRADATSHTTIPSQAVPSNLQFPLPPPPVMGRRAARRLVPIQPTQTPILDPTWRIMRRTKERLSQTALNDALRRYEDDVSARLSQYQDVKAQMDAEKAQKQEEKFARRRAEVWPPPSVPAREDAVRRVPSPQPMDPAAPELAAYPTVTRLKHAIKKQKDVAYLSALSQDFVTPETLEARVDHAIDHPTTFNLTPEEMLKLKYDNMVRYEQASARIAARYAHLLPRLTRTRAEREREAADAALRTLPLQSS